MKVHAIMKRWPWRVKKFVTARISKTKKVQEEETSDAVEPKNKKKKSVQDEEQGQYHDSFIHPNQVEQEVIGK